MRRSGNFNRNEVSLNTTRRVTPALGKWGGRNKYHQHLQDIIICLGGRIKPDIRIINELFIYIQQRLSVDGKILPTCPKPLTLAAILMGLDSVELVMEVEKHFSISIQDQEAEKAYTVGKLVDCVAKILDVKKYDFTLRESTFATIKSTLQSSVITLCAFSSTDKVLTTLDTNNKLLLASLEDKLKLKLPGLDTKVGDANGVLPRLQKWFRFIEEIDFKTITWKKYVDIILAFNLDKLIPQIQYNSKYEIYIAVMRITVDKIGVAYSEIGIEKSFTDDLGVD